MIDVYSLCPGGSGKKIKFCCRNRVDDFRKIYKFLDANQNTACLNFIDSLLKSDPDCACLLAIRCVILKSFPNRETDLIETAKHFYEKHPENPIAIAESAQAILLEGQQAMTAKYASLSPAARTALATQERDDLRQVIRDTISRYESAFSVSQPFQYEQVVFKLEIFVKALIKAGFYESANAWMGLVLDMELNPTFHEIFVNNLHQLKTSKTIPLCFRVGLKIQHAPADVPWKDEFDSIIQNSVLKIRWNLAVSELKHLAEKYPEIQTSPTYWFDLALLHEWLCDLSSAEEYWKQYLNCDGISFYEALEKQIRVSFFKDSPLEDAMDICTLRFPLTNAEDVLKKLDSEPTFRRVQDIRMQNLENGTLLGAFDVLDSPALESLDGVEVDDIPVVVGNVILWEQAEGEKKTGSLEVINVLQGGANFVAQEIQSVIGEWVAGEMEQTVTRSISVTLDSILRKIALPSGLSDEKVREIKNEHCRSILLNRWIHFPLGILKHQSIKNAAKNPKLRRQVETVIYAVRYLLDREKLNTGVLDELRTALNMDPMPEILPDQIPELSPIFFDQLNLNMLTPELLERVFFVSRMFNTNNIPVKILESVADDPAYAPSMRIEVLKALWSQNPQTERSLEIIEKGRELCVANNQPDVFFDIMEVACAINEGKFHTVFEKLKHIRQEHSDDKEAMQYVSQLSQYMYGIIQNMNPADLSALQKKTSISLSSLEELGLPKSPFPLKSK
ncbi:MAG: hypothetical protein E7028_04470 [Planctomycetaceae bacterium]|nr:hypothetical protein [Planctomycetaceae bacterium]MBQ2820515.1 hypothetical protein [Thermoguttaceae bacterium]